MPPTPLGRQQLIGWLTFATFVMMFLGFRLWIPNDAGLRTSLHLKIWYLPYPRCNIRIWHFWEGLATSVAG